MKTAGDLLTETAGRGSGIRNQCHAERSQKGTTGSVRWLRTR